MSTHNISGVTGHLKVEIVEQNGVGFSQLPHSAEKNGGVNETVPTEVDDARAQFRFRELSSIKKMLFLIFDMGDEIK